MPRSTPTRSSTAVAIERASVIAAQADADADARRCIGDCLTLRANRLTLAAKREVLDGKLSDSRRLRVMEDRRIKQVERAMARRDAARQDPVTANLAT